MREFYGSGQSNPHLMSPSSGQLVAIRAEEEEEILRAQVCEVMDEKVKVRRSFITGIDGRVAVGFQTTWFKVRFYTGISQMCPP